MKRIFFTTSLIVLISFTVQAQLSQLIYLKTFPGHTSLNYHPQDSVYSLVLYNYENNANAAILANAIPYELNGSYNNAVIMYDSHLNPISSIEVNSTQMNYEFIKRTNNDFFFMSNRAIPSGLGTQDFQSEPPLTIQSYPSNVTTTNMLRLNINDEPSLYMPFHCFWYYWEFLGAHPHTIPGFKTAAQAEGRSTSNRAAYINSGHIITTLTMFDDVEINWQDNYTYPEGNLWGTLWIKIDPLTGITTVSPLMSETGSMITFDVFPSSDNDYIYRTAVLRGKNIQVSPDGTMWAETEDDSLYHAVVIKENTYGEQQWMTQLYAYNKTSDDPLEAIITNAQTESMVHINGNIYLGTSLEFLYNSPTDSIRFIDFDGTEKHFLPPTEPGLYDTYIAHAERTIYQFDDTGQPIRFISQKLPFYENTEKNYFITKSKSNIFEINGILGWTNTYRSTSDTTIYFHRNNINNAMDSMAVQLPAGNGAYILWLDEELTILDVTNFPFSPAYDYNISLELSEANLYNNDTLLVSGKLRSTVTTRLDPQGIADEITHTGIHTFIGLYTVPEVLTSTETPEKITQNSLRLYPNPTRDVLHFENKIATGLNYEITDINGRIIATGKLSGENDGMINIKGLQPGMYILNIILPDAKGYSAKFVKE